MPRRARREPHGRRSASVPAGSAVRARPRRRSAPSAPARVRSRSTSSGATCRRVGWVGSTGIPAAVKSAVFSCSRAYASGLRCHMPELISQARATSSNQASAIRGTGQTDRERARSTTARAGPTAATGAWRRPPRRSECRHRPRGGCAAASRCPGARIQRARFRECATVHSPRCTGSAINSVISRASRRRRTASMTARGTGARGTPPRTTAAGMRRLRSTWICAALRTCLSWGTRTWSGRLWSRAASDTMSSACLQAGEDGVPAPVQQGCRDELSGRRMPGGHQDDAGCEALPGAAVPAPVVDGRLRHTQMRRAPVLETTPSCAAARRCCA